MVHHLNKSDMSIWGKFSNAISLGNNKVLQNSLGKWKEMSTVDWLDHWDFFLSKGKQFLHHRQSDNKWHRHLQRPNSHRTYHAPYMEIHDIPDVDLDRVSIKGYATFFAVVASSIQTVVALPHTPIGHAFGDINMTVPKIDWLMRYVSSSYLTDRLWVDILEGRAYAVSDGSYFPTKKRRMCMDHCNKRWFSVDYTRRVNTG